LGFAGIPANVNTALLASGPASVTLANNIDVQDDGATVGSVDDAVNNPTVNFTGTVTNNGAGAGQLFLQGGTGGRTEFTGRITGTGTGLNVKATAPGRRVVFDNLTGNLNDFAGTVTVGAGAVLQVHI